MLARSQTQPWFHTCSLSPDGCWMPGAAASLGAWPLYVLSQNSADREDWGFIRKPRQRGPALKTRGEMDISLFCHTSMGSGVSESQDP